MTKKYQNPGEPSLATTVKVNEKSASADKELTLIPQEAEKVTKVTDTVRYENLVPGKEYTVTGILNKVVGNTVTKVAEATVEVTASNTGNGTWDVVFDVTGKLQENTKYVVFETAVSKENLVDTNNDNIPDAKQVVEHKNPNDKAQTVVVSPKHNNPKDGELATTVGVNGKQASKDAELEITPQEGATVRTVKDTVDYTNLIPNEVYTLSGQLNKVVIDSATDEVKEVKQVAAKEITVVASDTGNGSWDITFEVENLEQDTRYVVYETEE